MNKIEELIHQYCPDGVEYRELLEIRFHSRGVYHYFNVPLNVYQNLMSASSHG